MGLTVNRQMAKKLTVNRQLSNIFTVNRHRYPLLRTNMESSYAISKRSVQILTKYIYVQVLLLAFMAKVFSGNISGVAKC